MDKDSFHWCRGALHSVQRKLCR